MTLAEARALDFCAHCARLRSVFGSLTEGLPCVHVALDRLLASIPGWAVSYHARRARGTLSGVGFGPVPRAEYITAGGGWPDADGEVELRVRVERFDALGRPPVLSVDLWRVEGEERRNLCTRIYSETTGGAS